MIKYIKNTKILVCCLLFFILQMPKKLIVVRAVAFYLFFSLTDCFKCKTQDGGHKALKSNTEVCKQNLH